MNHLPGYDAWLTNDPRDRNYGPCETCGHDVEDHDEETNDGTNFFTVCLGNEDEPSDLDPCECNGFI